MTIAARDCHPELKPKGFLYMPPTSKRERKNGGASGYSRRQFLRLASAAPLALAHIGHAGAASSVGIRSGAFDATHDSVLIWLKGEEAITARVDYGIDGETAQLSKGPSATLARDTDYCAAIPLTQLAQGESWTYRIVDAESGKPLSEACRFKTAPTNPQPFVFAFSADMDESYQPFKLFDVIDGKGPDFFLHLGDTVYADVPVRKPFSPTVSHYRGKHAANRKDPHLQKFIARNVTYAIWDDHETEDNCHGNHPYMERALQVFKEYWPCKMVDPAALYRHFSWGGIDFIILDTRRFRSPQTLPDGPEKTMLGADQKSWFKDRLKASKTPFKFIITSVPFHGDRADTWVSYRTESNELTRFIRGEKVTGIIFLTGDYHLARDWSNPKSGLKEFMAGPIASVTHYKYKPDARAPYEKAGTFHYGDGNNFGLWRVDPAAGKAKLEFIGSGGESLFQTELTA
jgi:alkaline phosphatase D